MSSTSPITKNISTLNKVQTDNFKYKPLPIIGVLELDKQSQILFLAFLLSALMALGCFFLNYTNLQNQKNSIQSLDGLNSYLLKEAVLIENASQPSKSSNDILDNHNALVNVLNGISVSDPSVDQKINDIRQNYGALSKDIEDFSKNVQYVMAFNSSLQKNVWVGSSFTNQIMQPQNKNLHIALLSILTAAQTNLDAIGGLPYITNSLANGITSEKPDVANSYINFLNNLNDLNKNASAIINIQKKQLYLTDKIRDILINNAEVTEIKTSSVLNWIGVSLILFSILNCYLLTLVYQTNLDKLDELRNKEFKNFYNTISILAKDFEVVGNGNLSKVFSENGSLLDKLVKVMNQSISYLRNIIKKIKTNVKNTDRILNQAHDLSKALFQNAQQQNDVLSRTVSSILQLTSNVKEVSNLSEEAHKVSQDTLNVAIDGGKNVEETSSTILKIREKVEDAAKRMKRLGDSSKKINDIILLMQDLSEKTNILAVNASVQASKAESGGGKAFDVIAQGMQKLAKQSSEAANKVKTLIHEAQEDVAGTMQAVDVAVSQTDEGARLAVSIKSSLDDIQRFCGILSKAMSDINQKVNHQARDASTVSKSLPEVSKGLEVNKKQYQEITNLMNDLSSSFKNLQTAIEQVNS